jgi:UDPglucose--hexose-1-phosphate uridylyltransferase
VSIDWKQDPHRRFNPLTGEWVLVSPHRTQRPWQGQVERTAAPTGLEYDPACYLCPGNPRAGGHRNPPYTSTFVFDNDFAALRPDTPAGDFEDGLLLARAEPGVCRVVCFSPRHDLTVARMSVPDIETVIETWAAQYRELGSRPLINSVQIFENRGDMMGASNPHPHCQIWSNESLPVELSKEQKAQSEYASAHSRCLLCDYVKLEEQRAERVVCANSSFLAVVPFWAVWPYETMLLSRRHVGAIDELTPAERTGLASIVKQLTTRYDNLFEISFPYTMGFHQRPTDGEPHAEWHMHAHYYPPLLRSATVRKFMVGYEMLANPQRDITPESAAARLRDLPETHVW